MSVWDKILRIRFLKENEKITKNFEKLHHEKILTTIMDEYGYANEEELVAAIANKSISSKISEYSKKQEEINKLLKKVKR